MHETIELSSGVLRKCTVAWNEVFARAEGLGAAHTPRLGTRSPDILHLATAFTLQIDTFLTFDVRQATLAMEAGLDVFP